MEKQNDFLIKAKKDPTLTREDNINSKSQLIQADTAEITLPISGNKINPNCHELSAFSLGENTTSIEGDDFTIGTSL